MAALLALVRAQGVVPESGVQLPPLGQVAPPAGVGGGGCGGRGAPCGRGGAEQGAAPDAGVAAQASVLGKEVMEGFIESISSVCDPYMKVS